MRWTDYREIAALLAEHYPEVDPQQVRFSQLRSWVLTLPEFTDNPDYCGERVLEAIQQAWMDEVS
ncbi:MAG: Fe-S cluster assembly protein IscX [Neisseriaceae bacterium]